MKKLASLIVCVVVCGAAALVAVAEEPTTPARKPAGSAASEKAAAPAKRSASELEAEFQKRLTGATLVGYFTEHGDKPGALKEDRYEITKLTKLPGEYWLFQTRIQYGGRDVNVPLPLRVVWADQTPVITLDQVPVPGLGTFSSRVVVDGDAYAGTWSGGDHGGHLFGVIEKPKSTAPAR